MVEAVMLFWKPLITLRMGRSPETVCGDSLPFPTIIYMIKLNLKRSFSLFVK